MTRFHAMLIAAGWAMWMALPASGQVLIDGGSASNNASGGAVRGRAPGQRVDAGIAEHQNFGGAPEVTDPAPDEDAARQFLLVESINTVFDQINEAILLFRDLLLLRAGRTPTPASSAGKADGASATAEAALASGRMVKLGLNRLQGSENAGNSTAGLAALRKK